MKRIYIFTLVTVFAFFTNMAKAQEFQTAISYMDYISKQHDNISKKYLAYTSASAHGKRAKKVEALREKLINEIAEAKSNINMMLPFKGDKAYRDSSVNFMKLYYNVMNDDYGKIVNMEEIAEQSYDEMEAIIMLEEKIDAKLEEANKMQREAQKKFGAANNINIVEGNSEMGEMLKQVSATNKHEHEVYLVFFKPYLQEKNLIQAISKGNVTAIEQSKSSLLKYAQEGQIKLATIKPYLGDNSLINACKYMLQFYEKEANGMATVSDFFVVKEKFDKMKNDFERNGQRTKEAIDTYNKGVNDMNAAANNYNNTLKNFNEQRSQNLDNWNNTVKSYFDNHIPKYK